MNDDDNHNGNNEVDDYAKNDNKNQIGVKKLTAVQSVIVRDNKNERQKEDNLHNTRKYKCVFYVIPEAIALRRDWQHLLQDSDWVLKVRRHTIEGLR